MSTSSTKELFPLLFIMACITMPPYQLSANEQITDDLMGKIHDAQLQFQSYENGLAVWNCTITGENHGKKANASQVTIKRHGESVLITLPTGIMCLHQDSFFALQGTPKTDTWSLHTFMKSDGPSVWKEKAADWYPALYPLQSARSGYTVASMMSDPSFKLIKINQLTTDLVELDYSISISSQSRSDPVSLVGTWTFSISRKYLLVKSIGRVSTTTSGQSVGSQFVRTFYEHDSSNKPHSIRLDYINPDTKAILNSTYYTFDYQVSQAVSPAEFTLEYYGITPPTDDVFEDRGFNWPLWGSLGVIAMVFSVLLRWYLRRRSRLNTEG